MAWATASRKLILRATGRTASGDVEVAEVAPASRLYSGVEEALAGGRGGQQQRERETGAGTK
jgi:hypothetical protein